LHILSGGDFPAGEAQEARGNKELLFHGDPGRGLPFLSSMRVAPQPGSSAAPGMQILSRCQSN
jgi:hypothetical protein